MSFGILINAGEFVVELTQKAGETPMKKLSKVLCFLFLASSSASADEAIVVDFTSPQVGPATANANGFWGEVRDGFPADLVELLRPVGFKGRVDTEITDDDSTLYKLNQIAAEEGDTAYLIVGLSNGKWRLSLDEDCESCDPSPCEIETLHWNVNQDLWNCWEDWIESNADTVEDYLRSQYPNVKFHYSIWNEPDLEEFWPGTELQFYQMWDSTYTLLQAADSSATITGPAIAFYNPGGGAKPNWEDFLRYCNSNDCLPDVFDLHSFDADGNGTRNENNFLSEIVELKQFMEDSLELDVSDMEFQIGEMIHESPCDGTGCDSGEFPEYMQPGSIVRHFALAERARREGLLFAFRSVWQEVWNEECDECTGDCVPSCELDTPWERGRLGGIVDPHPNLSLDKRYAWWVYKAYADMTGMIVEMDSTASLDGVASRDSVQARALIGGYRSLKSDTLLIRLKGLRDIDDLVINDVVHVTIHQMFGDSLFDTSGVEPDTVFNGRKLVFGDSLGLEVTGFGQYDAISIELIPIEPDTTPAPG